MAVMDERKVFGSSGARFMKELAGGGRLAGQEAVRPVRRRRAEQRAAAAPGGASQQCVSTAHVRVRMYAPSTRFLRIGAAQQNTVQGASR